MKIIKFLGGLGNQMFQYAFLEALKTRHKDEILADVTNYGMRTMHNGYVLNNVFGIQLPMATTHQIRLLSWYCGNYYIRRALNLAVTKPTTCLERHFYRFYPQFLECDGDHYYDGYWQNHAYFDDISHRLRDIFRFPEATDDKNRRFIHGLSDSRTHVCIHVRRGDYNKKIYRGLCGIDYYRQAIATAADTSHELCWHIFSNDIPWCRANIMPMLRNETVEFVDWNTGADSWRDMQLMSLCHVNIIANSSFSWWAAWLNQQPNKRIIAPKQWVNYPMEYQIQMPQWHLI